MNFNLNKNHFCSTPIMSTAIFIGQLESWQKRLVMLRQENAMLKFRLSELVDKSVLSDFLNRAEYFHSELLANDESISHIMDMIKEHNAKLKSGNTANSDQQQVLALIIEKFECRFNRLRKQFDQDMASASSV